MLDYQVNGYVVDTFFEFVYRKPLKLNKLLEYATYAYTTIIIYFL